VEFVELPVAGAFRVELEPWADERGFFARAWCAAEMAEQGLVGHIEQMNLSTNVRRGTIRGLHVQAPPHGEAKFFRCVAGRTFHVVADVRPDSPTYGRWAGVELDGERFDALYVPPFCATGYQAQTDGAAVLYGVSSPYAPGAETGLRWDDPAFAIEWPITDGVIVSEKDAGWPDVVTRENGSAT
jgi:dTDP-4-dehydrorhamnose 3,5-epimerase